MGCEIGRCNKKVAKKDLRESKESRPPTKEIWRWNETVQKVIIAKGNCHKTFYLRRIFGNFERYWVTIAKAKKSAMKVKLKFYYDL